MFMPLFSSYPPYSPHNLRRLTRLFAASVLQPGTAPAPSASWGWKWVEIDPFFLHAHCFGHQHPKPIGQ
jgi:hypothetical protein